MRALEAAFRESHRLGEKHAAARLLLFMARTVFDEPQRGHPALTYWANYRDAAIGLGYSPIETEDDARAAAAVTAVRRALRVLDEAGLVRQEKKAARGRYAVWLLTLDPIGPVDNVPRRSARGGLRWSKTDRQPVEDRPESGRRPTVLEVEDRPDTGRRPTPLSVRRDRSGREGTHRDARARAQETGEKLLEREGA